MADIRTNKRIQKITAFIARASGDVGSDTVGEDVSALLLALETHKTSGDHDGTLLYRNRKQMRCYF